MHNPIISAAAIVGLLAAQIVALVPVASSADAAEEQVRMLMERHNEVLTNSGHAFALVVATTELN